MITVKFYRKNCNIVKFIVSGHSNYDVYGKDIVCAAVSAAAQFALMGILETAGILAGYTVDDAYIECVLPYDINKEQMLQADLFVNTLYAFVTELKKQYEKYIQILELEV